MHKLFTISVTQVLQHTQAQVNIGLHPQAISVTQIYHPFITTMSQHLKLLEPGASVNQIYHTIRVTHRKQFYQQIPMAQMMVVGTTLVSPQKVLQVPGAQNNYPL